MIKVVVLHTGYVESGRMGVVMFRPNKAFSTPIEAVKSLAQELYDQWVETYRDYAFCCGRSYSKYSTSDKFCSQCGASLKEKVGNLQITPEILEEFERHVANLPGSTADDSGDELKSWWPWIALCDLLKEGPLDKDDVVEVEYPEPLFAAIVNQNQQAVFVRNTNSRRTHMKEPLKTFDEILASEITHRTI